MAERRHAEQGPTGRRLAENIARLRGERRHTTTAQLAQRVSDLGVPMTASTVTKIETQGRKVTPDELVALALALEVSPGTLLLPREDDGAPVRLTHRCSARWRDAWGWIHARHPLIASGDTGPPSALGWTATNRPYAEDVEQFELAPPLSIEFMEEDDGEGMD